MSENFICAWSVAGIIILCVVFFVTGRITGFNDAFCRERERWNQVGIENIAHHTTIVDGQVTTNWYEIVWKKEK